MGRRILKRENYHFPSVEEMKFFDEKTPNLKAFDFKPFSALISVLNKEVAMEEAKRLEDLNSWYVVFSNRLLKLRETYMYLSIYLERGFPDNPNKCDEEEIIDYANFNYYSEVFYYYFFSTRDVLAQILNVFYDIGLLEDERRFNKKIYKAISHAKVKIVLANFKAKTSSASENRNSLAHGFPINEPDYRSSLSIDRKNKTFLKGSGKMKSSVEIKNNIDFIWKELDALIIELKIYLVRDKP